LETKTLKGELITLSKKDSRFLSYINGTFSREHRALPVTSLNVNTESEQVTFQLVPTKEIAQPLLGLQWLQILKVRNFLMIMFPVFLVFAKNWSQGPLLDPWTGALASLGALCLMTAVNLRNDYLDHLSGLDRIHPQSGSRAIQNGWVTASQVKQWSFGYLLLGVLLGLKAVWLHKEILILVGIFALLGVLGMTSYKMGLKYRRWSEWAVFLLLGPLLTLGIQISIGEGFDLEVMGIGFLTGALSVFYLHLKNFEQLMVNDQANFQNTISWLGFENGKRWLVAWWIFSIATLNLYHLFYSRTFWQVAFLVVTFSTVPPFVSLLSQLTSPLSSRMKKLVNLGKKMILAVMILWAIKAILIVWSF
jgi:1,4-dihydroxy-2-naphthoate octaprenyltransferase